MRLGLLGAAFTAVTLLAACTAHSPTAGTASPSATAGPVKLTYLGTKRLAYGEQFQGTAVGGLSAISYDASSGRYYVLSDDRSAKNPVRFYTAALKFSAKGFDSLALTGTTPLRRPDGATFPPNSTANLAPDPEGLAVDPGSGQLYWSSEGERAINADGTATLADPAIRVATTAGRYVKRLPLPSQLHMSAQRVGPRRNQALEGLSFTPDGKQLYATMEDPLYQDGIDPTPTSGALNRVTRYDARTAKPTAQYAYPVEQLFQTPPSADSTASNGVSEALALGGGRLLVVERAVVVETISWKIRLYLADTAGATNVLHRESLTTGGKVTPVRKRLLLDLQDVPGLRLDNFEGATLGPRLPDGRRVLVLVTDDNFSWAEVTEFAAFAVSGL
jgi:hypothetical protein